MRTARNKQTALFWQDRRKTKNSAPCAGRRGGHSQTPAPRAGAGRAQAAPSENLTYFLKQGQYKSLQPTVFFSSINLLTSPFPWVQGGRRPIIEPYQYKDLNQSLSLGSRSMIVRFMKVLACLADI